MGQTFKNAVRIDGIVVSQLPIDNATSVELTNEQFQLLWLGATEWMSSHEAILDGVFCRNSDDCTAVYASTQGF